jgi:hypothetical protein
MQRATALYVALGSGVALGAGMSLAGVLYERYAGHAYLAMAGASLVGLGFALALAQSAQPPAGPGASSSVPTRPRLR